MRKEYEYFNDEIWGHLYAGVFCYEDDAKENDFDKLYSEEKKYANDDDMSIDLEREVIQELNPHNQHLMILLFSMKYKIDIALIEFLWMNYSFKTIQEQEYMRFFV